MDKSYGVLIYRGTWNLGDAVQTAALSRLLPGRLLGVYRDDASNFRPAGEQERFVVNGWLGDAAPPSGRGCVFAGVHLGRRHDEQVRWLAGSDRSVGTRDPFTEAYLRERGVASRLIGCSTLTLDRYRGPRSGRYAVDWFQPHTSFLTNCLPANVPWPKQWQMALELLRVLQRAAVVYTTRLHVALPCLAFGTPVLVPRRAKIQEFQPQRLSLLDALGVGYDEFCTLDVTPWAERYLSFLSEALGCRITPGDFRPPELPSG